MGAADGGRYGVTVGTDIAIAIFRPADRPFHPALIVGKFRNAVEIFFGHPASFFHGGGQIIIKAAGEVEHVFFSNPVPVFDQFRRTGPANLYPPEQIGLGFCQLK